MKNFACSAQQSLKNLYRLRVETLAEKLRPRFESGELRGWLESDNTAPWESVEQQFLEAEIPDIASAYLVLACSPSEAEDIDDGLLSDARSFAAECLATDVFREARRRGWWKPAPGEWIGATEYHRLSA